MRILVLAHPTLLPPEKGRVPTACQTEADVIRTLRNRGHEVLPLGLEDSMGPLRSALHTFQPHIVFNLLEEFAGYGDFESHIVSYLEMNRIAYTGCNSKGLQIAKDKGLTKIVLKHFGIQTPQFLLVPRGRRVQAWTSNLQFPVIVKANREEASRGLSRNSVVSNPRALKRQIEFMHEEIGVDVIVEEYIEGRELYVGLIGNTRTLALPVWELDFGQIPSHWPKIATEQLKWNSRLQKKYFVDSARAHNLKPQMIAQLTTACKRAYSAMNLNGYARVDLRLTSEGQIYILEMNPNPNIAEHEDFAQSALAYGIEYSELLEIIMSSGRRWRKLFADSFA